jgi:thymidylate kinase
MSTLPAIHPTIDRAVDRLDRAGLLSRRSSGAAASGATDDVTVPVVPQATTIAPDLLLEIDFAEVPDARGTGRLFATYDQATDRWLRLRLLPERPGPRGLAGGESLRAGPAHGAGSGMLVAIMGTDGAGKSTLSDGLAASFILPVSRYYAGLYPAGRRRYRAPGLGLAALLLRLFRMRVAGTVMRQRGRLVLFDRYAYDALLPLPPGSSLKSRLRRALLARSAPVPDLLVVLDAPVEVLHGRRREHPVEVVEAHRRFYAVLARTVPNAVVVDASPDADAVRRAVTALIWHRHIERRLRRGR